jgi:beta-1,4-mannosyl-glycoprotein beta-1,4-N-acetylglucosaminyltransferase
MKIYDCFIFFNENLLTEIRFNILDKFVDYFVVCESYYDHRGNIKGYLFDKDKFKKFSEKIIYVKIDKFPKELGIWERQDYQRDFLKNGLKNSNPDDLIIYSDADEIINPVIIKNLIDIENNVAICEQYCFYYKLNLLSDQYSNNWEGSRAIKYKNLRSFSWLRSIAKKNLKYSFFRFDRFKKIKVIKQGGWHFSYLMSEKDIQKKIKSWTHSELDTVENSDLDVIRKRVKENKDLFGREIKYSKLEFSEKYFPEYLVKNKNSYQNWII